MYLILHSHCHRREVSLGTLGILILPNRVVSCQIGIIIVGHSADDLGTVSFVNKTSTWAQHELFLYA